MNKTKYSSIILLALIILCNRQLMCKVYYNECTLLPELVNETVFAMPLLPKVHPFIIEKKLCNDKNPLIVGGQNATVGEFQYTVAIGYKQDEVIEWLCGGTLITQNFVLTAAHCASTKWGSPDVIHLGSLRLDLKRHENYAVEKSFTHPDYKPPAVYNDIALLKLVKNVKFDRLLQPACLSLVTNLSLLQNVVTAAGWGHTTSGGYPSDMLLKVLLRIIDNEECEKHYPLDKHLPNGIVDTMFCAGGYKKAFHDTCQGDSGGPVQATVRGDKCLQQVIGITSFGKYCGSGSPAIYVKVASHVPWIESVVNNDLGSGR